MERDFIPKKLILIGLNHKTAPVEVREKFVLKGKGSPLEILKKFFSASEEFYFLSTCNRVEFYFVVDKNKEDLFFEEFKNFIKKFVEKDVEEIWKYLYIIENEDAIKHLFEVACGLDSMVLGEPQILGQVKDAYKLATRHKTTGLYLNKLLHRCFFVAKRIRTETGIGGGAVSVSYAAYLLGKKILGDLSERTLLLVGAGEMAELTCLHFHSSGIKKIIIANRTFSRAVELAEKFGGIPTSLENLRETLKEADIVVSSTGSPDYVITYDLVKGVLKERRYNPLFIIDIAVPRDVEPKIHELENVYLYDIDDLKELVKQAFKEREKEAQKAKKIIEEEIIKFRKWLKELEVHPTIRALMEKGERIRKKEVERTLKRLKELSPEEKEALEILTKSIVQKILIYPVEFLKKSYHQDKRYIDIIQRIFKLDEDFEEKSLKKREEMEEKRDVVEKDKKYAEKELKDSEGHSKREGLLRQGQYLQ